jgi:hypothetical protein
MNLHRAWGEFEILGYCRVGSSPDDAAQNFLLERRQGCNALLGVFGVVDTAAAGGVEYRKHCFDKKLVGKRLLDEVDRSDSAAGR